jgi:ATP-dependent DNA helicase PIF1
MEGLLMAKQRVEDLLKGLNNTDDEPEVKQLKSTDPIKLSDEQEAAIELALRGDNLLLTGPGGTGKSETVRHLIRELRAKYKYPGTVIVSASTGAAAVNISGCTIHAFLGTLISKNVNDLMRNPAIRVQNSPYVHERLQTAKVIIIDEVSMLSGDFISMLDYRLRTVRQSPDDKVLPFGGAQLIFVGDFTQLPPVTKRTEYHTYEYAFESPAWRMANVKVVQLTKVFRQNDAEFIGHLENVRRGTLNEATVEYFDSRVGVKLADPTRLLSRNATVDMINKSNLDALKGSAVAFKMKFNGNDMYLSKLAEVVEPIIHLKVGAPVVFTRNMYDAPDDDGPRSVTKFIYANGERGTVLSISKKNGVSVRKRSGKTVLVDPVEYEYRNGGGRVVATAAQLPLRLAWAMTIHKAQGATLDEVECDVSECFQSGHAYVALSRARTIEGLSLRTRLDPDRIMASERVIKYYDSMLAGEDPYGDPFDPLDPPATRCASCGRLLGIPGGYEDSQMCGPCMTGVPEMEYEFGDMW